MSAKAIGLLGAAISKLGGLLRRRLRPSQEARLRRAVIDTLEQRRLLSCSISSGIVTCTGDEFDNDFRVWQITSSPSNLIYISVSGFGTYDFPVGDVTRVDIFGGDGPDEVVVEATSSSTVGTGHVAVTETIVIYGEGGADTLEGGDGVDSIYGGTGDDVVRGWDSADIIYGGDDDDHLFGNGGSDNIYGGNPSPGNYGEDTLDGGSGADGLWGDWGDDSLLGGNDGDWMYGEDDDDEMFGEAGTDHMYGGPGNDVMTGGSGTDEMFGGDGIDSFDADDGAGGDTVDGGAGVDSVLDSDPGDVLQNI
jgi:Ca2+-binding RTX toxin-like protein